MDPNAALAEIREITAHILDGKPDSGQALRLAELSEALDEWLSKGGFLPSAWAR